MTVPQHFFLDYRLPKKIEAPRQNETEDLYDNVVRDRLEVVENTPKHALGAASVQLLEEAELELELAITRMRRALAPSEAATYESLRERIRLQLNRCRSQTAAESGQRAA